MNIFNVLSAGHGNISETNMSAMLAYLLNPEESHGFNFAFLHSFLENIIQDKQILTDLKGLQPDVRLEYSVKKVRIDILIRFFEVENDELQAEKTVKYIFAIENKIKKSSATDEQLTNQYTALKEDLDLDEEVPICMVYLTPQHKSRSTLDTVFNGLKVKQNDSKDWVFWNDLTVGETCTQYKSIVSMLKELLLEESRGDIPPIYEYVKHTLKSMITHIQTYGDSANRTRSIELTSGAIPIDQVQLLWGERKYTIQKFSSKQIRIYNEQDDEDHLGESSCKAALKKIDRFFDLGIADSLVDGKDLNTQTLGDRVITELQDKQAKASS